MNKTSTILKILMSISLTILITTLLRHIFSDVFCWCSNDGSVQGLTTIFYYIIVFPITIITLTAYNVILFSNLSSKKIAYYIKIWAFTLLGVLISLIIYYINIAFFIHLAIITIYTIYSIKNSNINESKRTKNITLIILTALTSIFILIFLPTNPQEYKSCVEYIEKFDEPDKSDIEFYTTYSNKYQKYKNLEFLFKNYLEIK